MFGRKKEEVQEMTVHTAQQGKKGNVKEYLDSMSYLSRFVIEKKEALVGEEMKAIREIDKVKDSYTEVIEHNAAVSDAVDAFQTEFAKIGEISGQFNDVIQGVTTVSDGAIEDIRELKESSAKVEEQFTEIGKIYDEFQAHAKYRRHRKPDQPARVERVHRGGKSRRARKRICGSCG